MEEITLKIKLEDANAIMSVLGQLPTSSGAYPLLLEIKRQLEEQVNLT
jgi:hypothetical protein